MIIPKWQLELEQFNSLKTTFILEGNIYDLQPYYKENEEIRLITLDNYLYNYLKNNYTVIFRSIEGKSGIVPPKRNYKVVFRNTKQAENVTAFFNTNPCDVKSYVDENDFIVEVKNVPTIGQLTINCKGKDIEIDAVRVINNDVKSILLDLKINTYLKEDIATIMFSNLAVTKKRIEIRKLRRKGLSRQYMNLFLKLLEYISEF